jgi:hypothetical protein
MKNILDKERASVAEGINHFTHFLFKQYVVTYVFFVFCIATSLALNRRCKKTFSELIFLFHHLNSCVVAFNHQLGKGGFGTVYEAFDKKVCVFTFFFFV